MPDSDGILMLSPGLIVEEIDDEMVVLDLNKNTHTSLNDMGAVFIRLIQSGDHTCEELAQIVCSRYPDVPANQITRDVSAFIERLRANDMLVT